MISDLPLRTRALIIALSVSVFMISLAAFVLLTGDSASEDGSRTLMYAAAIIAAFIALNVILFTVGYLAVRKAKREQTLKKCVECGTVMDIEAKTCTGCGAPQPTVMNDSTYLEPKDEDQEIRPKG
ncbi:MAG: hypothetical protein LBV13_05920 [Methanomassiliicoccaceae archaeon]|jgi:heme/copper-type cytochrome/quinol oxidase subunit 2|nr:hypothetical protein [Methanomassiliicoccaceae archaeon]